jgi:16S rRNA (cytosine1402-N4)-methyltransferase
MASDFHHIPVLVTTTTQLFSTVPAGVVVDATVGAGGHSRALLESRDDLVVIGVDRDPAARDAARRELAQFESRALIVEGRLSTLDQVLVEHATFVAGRPIVGVLMDLGVSSPQLDNPSRGFSVRADAPLDMRMDTTRGITAAELIQQISEADLAKLLHHHGETRFARSIARSIKRAMPTTTLELVAAVETAVPAAARRRGHVAARTFQALRVEVNEEEDELNEGLRLAFDALSVDGVLAVISYHSGEDRVVKAFLRERETGGCTCPPQLDCVCGAVAEMRLLKASAVLASPDEVSANPRARSARLRAGWKVAS